MPMRKKLIQLILVLAALAAAQTGLSLVPPAAAACFTFCCPDTTICYTCCNGPCKYPINCP
jgi:hypothetical protein